MSRLLSDCLIMLRHWVLHYNAEDFSIGCLTLDVSLVRAVGSYKRGAMGSYKRGVGFDSGLVVDPHPDSCCLMASEVLDPHSICLHQIGKNILCSKWVPWDLEGFLCIWETTLRDKGRDPPSAWRCPTDRQTIIKTHRTLPSLENIEFSLLDVYWAFSSLDFPFLLAFWQELVCSQSSLLLLAMLFW